MKYPTTRINEMPDSALLSRKVIQKRVDESANLVMQSIELHNGPYIGCDECHWHEEQRLQNLHSSDAVWQQTVEEWQKHLTLD